MSRKRIDLDKSNFQLEFNDGGKLARRRTAFSPGGAYLFEDELKAKGVLDSTVITCAAWLLELFELESGEISFVRGEERIRPNTNRFGVFYPPFSITKFCFKNAEGYLKGIAAVEILPEKFSTVPTVFETTCLEFPTDTSKVINFLNSGDNFQSIEAYPKASLLSVKAKKLIDENYLAYPSIARIAERLNVSHAHLSRQFKLDFGLSPSNYFRQLRIADTTFLLAKGKEIINVSQETGYNDLSRFYKQFRQTTNTSPGVCQTIMKPNRPR
ncbi:MAG: AraC family transcriptional regulator [Acidobacteriota bacterium]|nr:AraC family transcriptional regulator [Acidobacteriota bacterium]